MLSKFFKTNFPVQYLTIGFFCLIIWSTATIHPVSMPLPEGPAPFYDILYLLLNQFPYIGVLLGFLIVLSESFWLNEILSTHNLIPKNSSLAAFLFIILAGFLPAYLILNPVNIVILFVLVILRALLESYHHPQPIELVFSAGFFISIAGFFYLPALFLSLFLIICFLIYRTFTWRQWVSALIGMFTPFLFLAVAYFWIDQLGTLVVEYFRFFSMLSVSFPVMTLQTMILPGFALLLALCGFIYTLHHLSEKTVEIRKKTLIVIWFFFWVCLTAPFTATHFLSHLVLAAIPLAAFIANCLLGQKKAWRFELLVWIFILLSFTFLILSQLTIDVT